MTIDNIMKQKISEVDSYRENFLESHIYENLRSYESFLLSNLLNSLTADEFLSGLRFKANNLLGAGDRKLLNTFKDNYAFSGSEQSLCDGILSGKSIVKINHGFWEIFSNIFLDEKGRQSLRARNSSLLYESFIGSGLLFPLLSSMYENELENDFILMKSLTSGVALSSAIIDNFSSKNDCSLDDIRRGVLISSCLFSDLFESSLSDKLKFSDSFYFNRLYQNKVFMSNVLSKIREHDNTGVIFFAPPHLKGLSLKPFDGSESLEQYYLAVSPKLAHQDWRVHIYRLMVVLEELNSKHSKVIVFFQGSVLGPLIASYLNEFFPNVTLIDFGRLLDVEVGHEGLNTTGSPFPNGKLDPTGFFQVAGNINYVFQKVTK